MQPTGYIDGDIAPLAETCVPVLDRGFLYGDSVYEVLRTYAGIPFMFEEHYARLMNSARLSMLQVRQSKQDIIDAIIATIRAAEVAPGEEVYVRYQITRGQGAIDLRPGPELQSRLIIIVKPAPEWNPDFYRVGMSLAIPQQRRNAVDALNPNIKGGNYLNNILGLTQARALGADDCLMLDANDRVTECSNSNAWFVLGGKPVTPASGNLLGITRKKLVDLLVDAGDGDAIERELHGDELARASECFVTSATREVMPVARLRLADGAVVEFPPGGGEVTRLAMRRYAKMLAEFVAANRDKAWF